MRLESGRLLKVHQNEVVFENQEELIRLTDEVCHEISTKYGTKVVRSFEKYSCVDEPEALSQEATQDEQIENDTPILTNEETGVIFEEQENKEQKRKSKTKQNDQI